RGRTVMENLFPNTRPFESAYTKVGSLVPSSSDGNFPAAPTVVYPNDPSDATKVTPAGVPTVPGYTAHDPEGHVFFLPIFFFK
ncbi:hypothetical protein ACE5SX_17855, partial [Lactiplantibacillus plantarum]|uniref:hypothetical protein n=1 Tax=Lactiplantibacillus plantarum TaxID=1590 RepID=UPI003C1CFED3